MTAMLTVEAQQKEIQETIEAVVDRWCPKGFENEPFGSRVIRALMAMGAFTADYERVQRGEQPLRPVYPLELPAVIVKITKGEKPPVTCAAKHTKYQPTNEEIPCPKCGEKMGEQFYTEEPDANANMDCSLLHENDFLYCHKCEDGIMGKALAAKAQKKANMVPCQGCRGTGMVKGGKANG